MTEARWPQDEDKLFKASTPLYDAPLLRDPGERFYRMPMGYKRAGDLLVEQAACDVVDRNNVIYAALFCYRQAVELFLKKLITGFGRDAKPPSGHDLSKLWNAFAEILRERGRANENGVQAVANIVAELHDADAKSDGFRYPTDNKRVPFKFGDREIDLENLQDVMEGVATFFDCVHTAFAHEEDMAAEMRSHLL